MSKEEIQNKIDSISADRDALERTRNKLTGDIALLSRQLAEAEKLKRRHGDFGFDNIDRPCLVIQKSAGSKCELAVASSTFTYGNDSGSAYVPEVKFGNIFDLLKEWSEDLDYFEFDVNHCEINTIEFPHAPIHIAGNWHTLVEAEEIWHKLGRVIATLKRRSPQE